MRLPQCIILRGKGVNPATRNTKNQGMDQQAFGFII